MAQPHFILASLPSSAARHVQRHHVASWEPRACGVVSGSVSPQSRQQCRKRGRERVFQLCIISCLKVGTGVVSGSFCFHVLRKHSVYPEVKPNCPGRLGLASSPIPPSATLCRFSSPLPFPPLPRCQSKGGCSKARRGRPTPEDQKAHR